MGIFDFLKSRAAPPQVPQSAPSIPNELIFKSGTAAIKYIQKFMKLEWKPHSKIIALLGHAELYKGVLCAHVLAPHDRESFVQLTTGTTIAAVKSQKYGRIPVGEYTDISALGLKSGDLVQLFLAGREPELIKLMPDNYDGWVAFVIGKASLTYSLRDEGFRMEKLYEL